MSHHYIISIPVKPHIKKFITAREGDPIFAANRSWLWAVVRPYLQYKTADNLSHKSRKKIIYSFTRKIHFKISISKVKSYGLHPRASGIVLINQFLDMYFAKELFWFVESSQKNPGRYKGFKKAIQSFCKKYDIQLEEDISTTALERLYRRHRDYNEKIGANNDIPA